MNILLVAGLAHIVEKEKESQVLLLGDLAVLNVKCVERV